MQSTGETSQSTANTLQSTAETTKFTVETSQSTVHTSQSAMETTESTASTSQSTAETTANRDIDVSSWTMKSSDSVSREPAADGGVHRGPAAGVNTLVNRVPAATTGVHDSSDQQACQLAIGNEYH